MIKDMETLLLEAELFEDEKTLEEIQIRVSASLIRMEIALANKAILQALK